MYTIGSSHRRLQRTWHFRFNNGNFHHLYKKGGRVKVSQGDILQSWSMALEVACRNPLRARTFLENLISSRACGSKWNPWQCWEYYTQHSKLSPGLWIYSWCPPPYYRKGRPRASRTEHAQWPYIDALSIFKCFINSNSYFVWLWLWLWALLFTLWSTTPYNKLTDNRRGVSHLWSVRIVNDFRKDDNDSLSATVRHQCVGMRSRYHSRLLPFWYL